MMRLFFKTYWISLLSIAAVFSVGAAVGEWSASPDPWSPPETTSITGTPGGGEILLRHGETSEPFCFLVGQVTTSGPSADAAGRGRMFFARTCDEEMKWKR